jgi:hypothetical protein
MYFFVHLFTGIILGLLLGDIFRGGRWLIPCAFGAILPDLIDKPVGFVLLPGIIGDGRFLFHSLPVAGVVLAAGMALWYRRGYVPVLAAGIGILSHQFLDAMWKQPVGWLDPLLGHVVSHRPIPPEYFLLLLRQNFEDPSEIFLGCVFAVSLALYLKRDRVARLAMSHPQGIRLFLEGSGIILGFLSGIILVLGILRGSLIPAGPVGLSDTIISAVVVALPAHLACRWGAGLGGRSPEEGCDPGPGSGSRSQEDVVDQGERGM